MIEAGRLWSRRAGAERLIQEKTTLQGYFNKWGAHSYPDAADLPASAAAALFAASTISCAVSVAWDMSEA
jgi:hypothetical protein